MQWCGRIKLAIGKPLIKISTLIIACQDQKPKKSISTTLTAFLYQNVVGNFLFKMIYNVSGRGVKQHGYFMTKNPN